MLENYGRFSNKIFYWRNSMNQMNQIVIEGNVVRDSQVRETPRGTKVCLMSIATNRFYKDMKGAFQKETAFFDVEAWGENFSSKIIKMAKKGRGCRVIGRLKQDRWKTQEGKNASKVSIIAEHIDFQPQKTSDESSDEAKNMAENAAEGMMAEASYGAATSEFMDGGETVF